MEGVAQEAYLGRSFLEVLTQVPDPRSRHGQRHPLAAVLALGVAAMLSGARGVTAIAQWGRDQGSPMAQALGFRRERTACASTLHEVFSRLDRERFEQVLGGWLQAHGLLPAEAVAVDGKTLRGVHGQEFPGVHLVAALAHQRGLVVGQQAAAGKGQELEALGKLLGRLPLQGRVVTGDAQFTQREVCQTVVQKGGTTC